MADIIGKVPSLEATLDERERDLQKVLLEHVGLERLLGLVINREGHLNPHLVRDTCERFIQITRM